MIPIGLLNYRKVYISLEKLMDVYKTCEDYDSFYKTVMLLVDQNILEPMAKSGVNQYHKSLNLKYRVNQLKLNDMRNLEISRYQSQLSPQISLENYYSLPAGTFDQDIQKIVRINQIIDEKGLPGAMCLPELSYYFFEDEKWIDQEGGVPLLKRIGLWSKLTVLKEADPLAFAINPNRIYADEQRHLIVENKTPFIHMSKYLEDTSYNTLIYGQGWKIISALKQFFNQYPFGQRHQFDYFGDLDREGLAIYAYLSDRYRQSPYRIQLAMPFYALLSKRPSVKGKTNQRTDEKVIETVIEELNQTGLGHDFSYIEPMLSSGYYQPQEELNEDDLKNVLLRS